MATTPTTTAHWSWVSLDGKSVAAIPSGNRIDIVDTQDFSLLSRIQNSPTLAAPFHDHPVIRTIWNARRICLLSLSSTALAIHVPTRDKNTAFPTFTLQWFLPLEANTVSDVAFSRCGHAILLGGSGGLALWTSSSPTAFQLSWQDPTCVCDTVEFSPCRTVFASHKTLSKDVYVWRHHPVGTPTAQILNHEEEVEFISWKPTHYQPQTSDDHDGTRPSSWDEPACVLLTMTRSKAIRIWVEDSSSNQTPCQMTCAVFLHPSDDMDILHTRWIMPRAQNISEEYFGPAATAAALPRERLQDWLTVVDVQGVLHVWAVETRHHAAPTLVPTSFLFKIDGEEDVSASPLVASFQVAGYASQGFLSSVSILVERMDQVLLMYQVAWAPQHAPVLKAKSWYRGHTAPIEAMATHPSLPLVATVSHPSGDTSELIVFWLSVSMFTREAHFVPSCIVRCRRIAAVHWIPTLHFQARPLLLVAYYNGDWEIYTPTNHAFKSRKPRTKLRSRLESMYYPWTFHEPSTGESGFEFDVELTPDPVHGLGVSFKRDSADKIVVSGFLQDSLPAAACGQITAGDECIEINGVSMRGKSLQDVKSTVQSVRPNSTVTLRFRTPGTRPWPSDLVKESSSSSDDALALGERERELSPDHPLETVLRPSPESTLVKGGSISKFGGWSVLGHLRESPAYDRIAVAPLYSDAGNFVSNAFALFGVTNARELHCWLGVEDLARPAKFEFVKLHVKCPTGALAAITTIGTERDYRQRAFAAAASDTVNSIVWNALLFVGNASGALQHWRCRVSQSARTIDLSLVHACDPPPQLQSAPGTVIHTFYRRGVCPLPPSSPLNKYALEGVFHMELDDPNRLAVVYASAPESLFIWEGESGLGMLRLEAVVHSEGRGRILGFSWCSGHVEFLVDPLVVHFTTCLVVYSYDVHLQTWIPQTELSEAVFFPLVDCTRDASAVILAAGSAFPRSVSYHEVPTVVGKWDVHRHVDQADQKHCPVWHPYTLLTTLCGMPARVGLTHTLLADYRPAYDVQTALGEAEQMLKLLAHVLEDDASTDLSAENGVLIYLHEKKTFGRRASVGRYASHPSNAPLSRAEDLFASNGFNGHSSHGYGQSSQEDDRALTSREVDTLMTALDAILRRHTQKVAVRYEEQEHRNAYVLFDSFELEHVLELKGLLIFLQKMHTVLLHGYDLPAQRYFVAYLLTTCLQEVMQQTDKYTAVSNEALWAEDGSEDATGSSGLFVPTVDSYLHEVPSSSVLWALHSQSQNLLVEQCIHPQAVWEDLRPLWPGLWVRDPLKLRSIVEKVAKCTFTRTKDAMTVCLLYIALNKQNVLGALAKVSRLESNKTLADFLAHDFSEERWSHAAIRNAYSLLRKKQYELAAAFFLLPHPPRLQESLRIIISRLHDPSLAMVIARLMEYEQQPHVMEDTSDIFHVGDQTTEILRSDLIPHFRSQNNRWLESAALWWLNDFDQAAAVLQPASQMVDVVDTTLLESMQASSSPARTLVLRTKMTLDFLINLTSLPLYFQFCYCDVQLPLLKFAYAKLLEVHPTLQEEDILTTQTDIDHAYSFTAYVCKHTGLTDTALLQMLQARHLLTLHVTKNFLSLLDTRQASLSVVPPQTSSTNKTAFEFQNRTLRAQLSFRLSPRNNFFGSPRAAKSNAFARRTSIESFSLDTTPGKPDELEHGLLTDSANDYEPVSLWPKAEIADMECRRWSSSAFVGKMIGIRVAREMISHFRVTANDATDHHAFIHELIDPLSAQFKVDRDYILEATLIVLQPHAPLHLVECCFVLAELHRTSIMQEWIQCVGLSMLHATAHFSTVDWTDEVLREWKHLVAQLMTLAALSDAGSLAFSFSIRLVMDLAIQLGSLVLAWCTNHPESLHDIVLTDVPTVLETFVVAVLQDTTNAPCHRQNFGYTFLDAIDATTPALQRMRQLYSTILMTQIVRTIYCRDQQLLHRAGDEEEGMNIDAGSNGLYMPKMLWRAWIKHPLAGLKRWYLAMEAHVQLELHQIVADAPCRCGIYGMDLAARQQVLPPPPLNGKIQWPGQVASDEELLLWMQHPSTGVATTLRRFRLEPRVFIACFTLKDAFVWLHDHGICETLEEAHEKLARWCKLRHVRWLVRRRSDLIAAGSKISLELIPDEAFCFVSPWQVEATHNVSVYMHGEGFIPEATDDKAHLRVDLGWECLLPLSDSICEDAARVMFPNDELKSLWQSVRGEGWLVTAVQHFEADGLYMKQSSVHGADVPRSKFLADLFKQVQRNRLFRHLGLPHRLVACVTVELVEGKDLLACDLLSRTADPYVFMSLVADTATSESYKPTPTGWSIQSYRSRNAHATLDPKWNTADDQFPFRIAFPVHEPHEELPALVEIETLLRHAYGGPPTTLAVSVYNKCKVRQHPYMGTARVSLNELTASQPMDVWVKLEEVSTGSLHFRISLKYELMSSTAYEEDFGEVRFHHRGGEK
ncbi:unnamed protein product [Aphanomyces euteiches]|nr:hypothetical protein AeRB84_016705 [Aphanomyces euteiches]